MNNSRPVFRTYVPEDRESIARNANNVKIFNNMRDGFPYPYGLADAENFIALSMAQDPQRNFAIDVDGWAVGGIGYIPRVDVERVSAEVGYWLGEDYWGKGIMTKVMTDFADFLFATTELTHLFAGAFSINPASMRVLEKAGFTPAGVFHKAALKNGRLIDLHYYEKVKPGV